MASQPLLCVIDDQDQIRGPLVECLKSNGYRVRAFPSGKAFLETQPQIDDCDLILSDVSMPGIDGYELCREIRRRETLGRIPIILMTGRDPSEKAVGIEAGSDDFITKPFQVRELLAKIRSLLDIRAREKETHSQLNRLGRFLSPNLAELLSPQSHRNDLLKPHRAEVTVLFVDLRNFTAFSEREEPEEVLNVLNHYYSAVGNLAVLHGGTLGHLAGDGIMVFFNDPVPLENHMRAAAEMAIKTREMLDTQQKIWQQRQYGLGFGMGMAAGFATIGEIGFDQYSQYSVIGTVTNLASRLCHLAENGQILISERFQAYLQDRNCPVNSELIGERHLKGIERPVNCHNLVSLREEDALRRSS